MSNKILNVTSGNFESVINQNEVPVVVDFWASWCGPCRMLTPILEEVAEELDTKAIIAKVNVDDEPKLAEKFGIINIPTILIFQNGEMQNKFIGVRPKNSILSEIKKYI